MGVMQRPLPAPPLVSQHLEHDWSEMAWRQQ